MLSSLSFYLSNKLLQQLVLYLQQFHIACLQQSPLGVEKSSHSAPAAFLSLADNTMITSCRNLAVCSSTASSSASSWSMSALLAAQAYWDTLAASWR